MNTFQRLANRKSLTGAFILFFLISGICFPIHRYNMNHAAGKSIRILDLRLSYTQQEVLSLFNDLTPEGRAEYYFQESVTDMAYPIIYAGLLILLITYLSKHLDYRRWWILLIAPILAMFFDFSENSTILSMLGSYPDIAASTVFWCTIFSKLKWSFVILSILMVFWLAYSYRLKTNASSPIKKEI